MVLGYNDEKCIGASIDKESQSEHYRNSQKQAEIYNRSILTLDLELLNNKKIFRMHFV